MSTAEKARVLRATKMQRDELDRVLREFADAKLEPDVEYSQFNLCHETSEGTRILVELFRNGPAHRIYSDSVGLWGWDAQGVPVELGRLWSCYEMFRDYEDWNVVFIDVRNTVTKTDINILYDGAGCIEQARRVGCIKQELVEKTWHPSRFATWCLDTEEAAVLGG